MTYIEPTSPAPTVRILVVDDHRLFREGLKSLLATIPGVQVVGEACDGESALAAIPTLKPRVLLTDISMPGIDGIELVRRTREQCPDVLPIVLSMHNAGHFVHRAMQAGALGYLVKDCAVDELGIAIRAVCAGHHFLSPEVSAGLFSAGSPGRASACLDALTPRQQQVLQMVAEGLPTKAIALRLDLSVKTVDTHRAQIMQRLGIHDLPGLVRFAIHTGLVRADT